MESSAATFDNGFRRRDEVEGTITMVTFWGVLVVLGFLAVARYGADTRSGEDPTGRDPAWPVTRRPHTVRGDAVLFVELAHRAAAHGRLWAAFDRSLRPWESERELTRRS
jgi:hypothetical protein